MRTGPRISGITEAKTYSCHTRGGLRSPLSVAYNARCTTVRADHRRSGPFPSVVCPAGGANKALCGHQHRPRNRQRKCALDPHLIEVDYWKYLEHINTRHATPDQRAHHRLTAVMLNQGDLGDGLTGTWIEPFRQDTIRATLDAATSLTHNLDTLDPDLILDALERARQLEPHNEKTYQNIIQLQIKIGRHDAAARTYKTLQRKLAEIDIKPTQETRRLIT
jgi:Bacterial transcriptional activator domain